MKVFVTGGAGYVGSVCVERLLDDGFGVVVFLSAGHREAVDRRAELVVGDLLDAGAIRRALLEARPDAVMHFAASALVGESMRDPAAYFRNNVVGGLNLLDAMREAGVQRIVFSSTCAVFGVPAVVPISEDAPKNPVNPYGESKLMFERMLHWHGQVHGLIAVVLRYFNVAGASDRRGEAHRVETHLIPLVLQVPLGQRDVVEIFGDAHPTRDGSCVRDFVHVLDLAEAHVLALAARAGGVYHLGNGRGHSVFEVVSACERVTGCAIAVRISPARPGDPPQLVADARRIANEFGWTPRCSDLDAMVKSAWRWHSGHRLGYAPAPLS